jgi:CheY-like chemotaxis protein
VEQILNAGRHLLALIDQLGDISQIEMGVFSVSFEAVEVGGALRDAVALIAPMAREEGIELIAVPAKERFVRADRQRLRQVLLNLLSNAVKYNRARGSITVSFSPAAGERLRIEVADTGRGVAASDLERLFVAFDRLGAEDAAVHGSGLGLALSRSMVEQMGGTLTARSEPGRGSVFTVELPTSPGAPGEDAGAGAGGAEQAALRLQTILYIEDNLANFKLVEETLSQRREIQVMLAIQGGLGLDVARLHHPDLILLDLELPDMGGEQVLERLVADPETRAIPVIVLSADARPARAERLLAAGAKDYLTKPLDIKRFLAVVNGWLSVGSAL